MPTFATISPAGDTQIAAATSLQFEVTDPLGLAAVFIYLADANGGTTEVIWTGDGFGPRYTNSTAIPIINGLAFTLNRVGGWDSPPMLRVKAIANNGNSDDLSLNYTLQVVEKSLAAPVVGQGIPVVEASSVTEVLFGRGLTIPFQRDGKGDFANGSDADLVASSIEQILSTVGSSDFSLGEVPWRPEFGSLLYLLRYKDNNGILQALAQQYVLDAVEAWEPRVRVLATRVEQEESRLSISLRYNIINKRRDVVSSGLAQNFTTTFANS